ncbi:MAG: DUF6754 domain-containing protein [bacterium]
MRFLTGVVISICLLCSISWAQATFKASLSAIDTPGDGGESIDLRWEKSPHGNLLIMRSFSPDQDFSVIAEIESSLQKFRDNSVKREGRYYYRIASISGEDTVLSKIAGPAIPRSNYFRKTRANALVAVILMFVLVAYFVDRARKGQKLYIRPITGVNAVSEAVGRATEMGKKILYVPGILGISDIETIASLAILKHIGKLTAIYGTDLEVANKDPLVYSAVRETLKEAYLEAGKPDQYKESMVSYLTYDQFAYAASVTAKMVRERPATNFLVGSFFAESLIFAETGQSIGAIQIAGTAHIEQLPFFVTTCDYVLMGEELFAASAYLSKEPVLLGSIKAQDMVKAILMALILVGIITYSFGWDTIKSLLLSA